MPHASTSASIAAIAAVCSLFAVACGPADGTDATPGPTTVGPSTPAPIGAPTNDAPANEDAGSVASPQPTAGDLDPDPDQAREKPHATGVVHVVQVGTDGFTPSSLDIPLGDSIDFVWATSRVHTVTSGLECLADGMFASGPRSAPSTYRVTFLRPGPFLYFSEDDCHGMVGSIVVEE